MPFITTKDGTEIYYKDWGNPSGPVVALSHGWPLNADNWENQMVFLADHGCRVVAHDRRGHGRSSQPWNGNNVDQWADDLHELFEHLDLKNVMMVGHSTGGGEIARYCTRHGLGRVSKVVLISCIPPQMLKTDKNPIGLPLEVFDSFRQSLLKDRAQFFVDVPTGPFFGYNRPGAKPSQGQIWSWWQQGNYSTTKKADTRLISDKGMICGFKAAHDTVASWQEDYSEDLKKMDIPVLLIHGDDDQIVPIDAAARTGIKLLPNGKLKEYPGGAHALPNLEIDSINEDLLDFLQS
jgi:non-heme chloroperoxidase